MRPALRFRPLRSVYKDDGIETLAVPLAPFDPVVVLSGHEELRLEPVGLCLRNRLFRFQLHVISSVIDAGIAGALAVVDG